MWETPGSPTRAGLIRAMLIKARLIGGGLNVWSVAPPRPGGLRAIPNPPCGPPRLSPPEPRGLTKGAVNKDNL